MRKPARLKKDIRNELELTTHHHFDLAQFVPGMDEVADDAEEESRGMPSISAAVTAPVTELGYGSDQDVWKERLEVTMTVAELKTLGLGGGQGGFIPAVYIAFIGTKAIPVYTTDVFPFVALDTHEMLCTDGNYVRCGMVMLMVNGHSILYREDVWEQCSSYTDTDLLLVELAVPIDLGVRDDIDLISYRVAEGARRRQLKVYENVNPDFADDDPELEVYEADVSVPWRSVGHDDHDLLQHGLGLQLAPLKNVFG